MINCIFCKIITGKAPANIVFRDDQVTAFRDLHPAAPTHVLVVPNRHLDSLNDLEAVDESLAGHLLVVARQIAQQEGIADDGYRLILNTGPEGGQTVFHLHLHLMGGKRMRGFSAG